MTEPLSNHVPKTTHVSKSRSQRFVTTRKATVGLIAVLLLFVAAYSIWKFKGHPGTSSVPAVVLPGMRGDLMVAMNRARARLERMPRSGDAWGHYGMLLMQHDRPKEALTCFEEASRLDVANPKWYYFAGVILEQTDLRKALRYLQMARERNADYVPMMLRISTILITMGEFDSASEVLDQIRDVSPETSEIWIQLVRLTRIEGHSCDSAQWLMQARSSNAVSGALLRETAIAEMQCGRATQARQLLAEANTIAQDPVVQDPWMEELQKLDYSGNVSSSKADNLRASGKISEAAQALQSLARRFPERSRPALNFALMLRDQGKIEEAIRSLNSLVDQFPEDPLLRFHLAVLLAQFGSPPEQVLGTLNEALRLKPDYGVARAGLADMLQTQGRNAEALENYARAVTDSPADPWIRLGFTSALIAQRQRSEAESQVKQLDSLLSAEQTNERRELETLRLKLSQLQLDAEKLNPVENR